MTRVHRKIEINFLKRCSKRILFIGLLYWYYHILRKKRKSFNLLIEAKINWKKNCFNLLLPMKHQIFFSRECAYGSSHKLDFFFEHANWICLLIDITTKDSFCKPFFNVQEDIFQHDVKTICSKLKSLFWEIEQLVSSRSISLCWFFCETGCSFSRAINWLR